MLLLFIIHKYLLLCVQVVKSRISKIEIINRSGYAGTSLQPSSEFGRHKCVFENFGGACAQVPPPLVPPPMRTSIKVPLKPKRKPDLYGQVSFECM